MELVLRSAAVALSATLAGLLLKKNNPELSLTLSMTAVTVIMIAALSFIKGILELGETVQNLFGVSETLVLPVIKCVAVAITTKVAADLCRDSSQGAAASSVELAGTVCAISVIMPLIVSMLKTIGGLL